MLLFKPADHSGSVDNGTVEHPAHYSHLTQRSVCQSEIAVVPAEYRHLLSCPRYFGDDIVRASKVPPLAISFILEP